MPPLVDMTGQTIGRWTVLSRDLTRTTRDACWHVRCECGNVGSVAGYSLRSGSSLSCGCLTLEVNILRTTTHGMSDTVEYRTWYSMKRRCGEPGHIEFKRYGARGIRVCPRWINDFAAFYADMGPRPSPTHSVDRLDNDGDYSPENCRWATLAEQNSNKRTTRFVVYRGERMCLAHAVRLAGSVVRASTANARIGRGWDVATAVETRAQGEKR